MAVSFQADLYLCTSKVARGSVAGIRGLFVLPRTEALDTARIDACR